MDRRDEFVEGRGDPRGEPERHATTGGAAAAGAATGAAAGAIAGSPGAVPGALGGAAIGAASERVMHAGGGAGDRWAGADAGMADRPPASRDQRAGTQNVSTIHEGERVIELREEQLVAHKDMREMGQVQLRKYVEEGPGRLEVQAYREEVEIEHVPVGQVVRERVAPWEEGDALIVPVYEEQLVVVKRLFLREQLRIRRVATTELQVFEDTLRRERLEIEDPTASGLVREQFPTDTTPGAASMPPQADMSHTDMRSHDEVVDADDATTQRTEPQEESGFLEKLVRKALQ